MEDAHSEQEILERLKGKFAREACRELIAGIGDDCAIWRPEPGQDLLFTTDLLLEEIHFRRETHPPEAIGHKALVRGLSDIAAMGGGPRFCLLSLAVPEWADNRWLDRLFDGLLEISKRTRTVLAGGDLARAPRLAADIIVCGSVPRGTALRRDGARPGDGIYVSGALGGSALGLATGTGDAWRRHLWPEPRLALGRFLRETVHASAAMDLSDGLSLDLQRLCAASGVAAEITDPPVFPGATLDQALNGGEDYELLFTCPEAPAEFEGLALTRIGGIVAGEPGRVRLNGQPLPPKGYDHFLRP